MHSKKDKSFRAMRRSVLKGAGALAFAPLAAGLGGAVALAAPPAAKAKRDAGNHRTQLVLLGTTGGMTWWPGSDRASASQVLVVGDAMYVIDLGFGATHRMAQAFNQGRFTTYKGEKIQDGLSSFLAKVRAVFITHMHMDHLGDYATFLEIGARAGFGNPEKLKIIGPGNRGRLEENVSGYAGTVQTAGTGTPLATPTPGIRQTTDLLLQAFATTFNNCTHDEGYPDIPNIIEIQEIGDPKGVPWPANFRVPDPGRPWTRDDTCPAMDPFPVYSDDLVRVSAVLVDHYQVYPSFAFRFDTDDGSVVISGDTGPNTSGNLQKLAQGADVLVHEVLDNVWADGSFRGVKQGDPAWPLYSHTFTAHTSIDDVGKVAEQCRAKTLVLSHIGPGNTPVSRLRMAQKGFSGRLVVGEDLMRIGVGKPRRGARG
jgi:ribonuclease BN (tRNA processing enzyme)